MLDQGHVLANSSHIHQSCLSKEGRQQSGNIKDAA